MTDAEIETLARELLAECNGPLQRRKLAALIAQETARLDAEDATVQHFHQFMPRE